MAGGGAPRISERRTRCRSCDCLVAAHSLPVVIEEMQRFERTPLHPAKLVSQGERTQAAYRKMFFDSHNTMGLALELDKDVAMA